eukprot:ANDGO_01392.mRNA.1 hypothetical protein
MEWNRPELLDPAVERQAELDLFASVGCEWSLLYPVFAKDASLFDAQPSEWDSLCQFLYGNPPLISTASEDHAFLERMFTVFWGRVAADLNISSSTVFPAAAGARESLQSVRILLSGLLSAADLVQDSQRLATALRAASLLHEWDECALFGRLLVSRVSTLNTRLLCATAHHISRRTRIAIPYYIQAIGELNDVPSRRDEVDQILLLLADAFEKTEYYVYALQVLRKLRFRLVERTGFRFADLASPSSVSDHASPNTRTVCLLVLLRECGLLYTYFHAAGGVAQMHANCTILMDNIHAIDEKHQVYRVVSALGFLLFRERRFDECAQFLSLLLQSMDHSRQAVQDHRDEDRSSIIEDEWHRLVSSRLVACCLQLGNIARASKHLVDLDSQPSMGVLVFRVLLHPSDEFVHRFIELFQDSVPSAVVKFMISTLLRHASGESLQACAALLCNQQMLRFDGFLRQLLLFHFFPTHERLQSVLAESKGSWKLEQYWSNVLSSQRQHHMLRSKL